MGDRLELIYECAVSGQIPPGDLAELLADPGFREYYRERLRHDAPSPGAPASLAAGPDRPEPRAH